MEDYSSSSDECLDVSDLGDVRVCTLEKTAKRKKIKQVESESEWVEPCNDYHHYVKPDMLTCTSGEKYSQLIYKNRLNYGSLVKSKMASNHLRYLPFMRHRETQEKAIAATYGERVDNLINQISDLDKNIKVRILELNKLHNKYKVTSQLDPVKTI